MDKRELPENIRQAIDLIAAVLRRIKAKELDKRRDECLYIEFFAESRQKNWINAGTNACI